jgi:hypothetical protein
MGLVEERRHPRRVQERNRAAGDGRFSPAPACEHSGCNREPDAEEDSPVVRIEQQDERRDEHDQPAATTLDHTANERESRDEREQRRKGVHARFLGVVGEVRVDRSERGADPGRSAAEDRTRRPERDRDARERRQQRQNVRRALAVAEPPDPDVEQQVVERG